MPKERVKQIVMGNTLTDPKNRNMCPPLTLYLDYFLMWEYIIDKSSICALKWVKFIAAAIYLLYLNFMIFKNIMILSG